MSSHAATHPRRRSRIAWLVFDLIAVAVIAVAVLGTIIAPRVLSGIGQVLGGFFTALGAAVTIPCEMAVDAAEQHPQVHMMIGSPLKIVDIAKVEQAAPQTPETLALEFTAQGPHGQANFYVVARAHDDGWDLQSVVVEPLGDPTGRIVLVEPDEHALVPEVLPAPAP